jgi:hypothetical protein
MIFRALILLAAVTLPSLAWAQACDKVVDDQAHVISDVGKVEAAAKSLGNQGATVRVRTFASVGADGLGKTIYKLRAACPSWQGQDSSSWKSTMLVLAYTPDKYQVGAYYGSTMLSRLGQGKWSQITTDRLNPAVIASAHGDKTALADGMTKTLEEMQAALARPSTGGAVTIHQASDLSGLWHVMGWLLVIVVLVCLVLLALYLFSLRGKNQTARAQARRARSECISGILEINDDKTIASATATILAAPADKQAALNSKLNRVQSLGTSALSTLSQFDNAGGSDPNENLSSDAYASNQRRYEGIIREYVTPAKRLLAEIQRGEVGSAAPPTPRAPQPPQEPPSPPAPTHFLPEGTAEELGRQERGTPWTSSSTAPHPTNYPQQPPQPQQPQVVERVVERGDGGTGNLLTGMLLGEMLSRRDEEEPRRHRRDYSDDGDYQPRRRESDDTGGGDYSGGNDNSPTSASANEDDGGDYSVDVSQKQDDGGDYSVDVPSSGSSDGGSYSVDTSSSSSSSC